MAYPNATESPTEFLKHLQSLELELATQAFQHFQKRPIQGANVRLDAPSALQWGERMDTLLGKLGRFKGAYPEQSDLLTYLINICTRALLEIETAVMIQERADDEAEKEKKVRAEKLAREQKGFTDAERVVEEKRQVLHDAQKDGDDNEKEIDEDVDEDDEGTQFPPEEQPGKPKKQTQIQTEQDPRRKLQQVTHSSPCQLCLQKKVLCSGPVGQACDVCSKQKKSCSNGGRRREATVKEEPKSPTQPAGRKRKAFSTTDSKPIGVIDGPINVDFNSGPPVGKQSKLSSGSTPRVHFDAAETSTSTRKSTRSTTKKDLGELFKQLGEEYGAVSETFEKIADLVD